MDYNSLSARFDELLKLDMVCRESAVTILKWPQVLTDPMWISNLRTMLQVIAMRTSSKQAAKPVSQPSRQLHQPPRVDDRSQPTIFPAAGPPALDPQVVQFVASILQQPNGAQQLFQMTQSIPPDQAALISGIVKHILSTAAVQPSFLPTTQPVFPNMPQTNQFYAAPPPALNLALLLPQAPTQLPAQPQPPSYHDPAYNDRYYEHQPQRNGGRDAGRHDSYHATPYSHRGGSRGGYRGRGRGR